MDSIFAIINLKCFVICLLSHSIGALSKKPSEIKTGAQAGNGVLYNAAETGFIQPRS